MNIKLSNTLGKKKEIFKPIKQGELKLYSCGPTVYHHAHIGNLRSFLLADLLKRMFILNNYKVKHIINITDVGHLSDDGDEGEDKLEKGAKREGKSVWDIAKYYTDSFIADYDEMNFIRPFKFSKATEHIQNMIDMIKTLEKNGYTYISEGNVYFDTQKFSNYGKLIKISSEEDSQARVDEDTHKKSRTDFVLWFTRHKHGIHAMEWDSPWGKGFPGWHIECSAMGEKYLGDKFDIHTGGHDLAFVHHTNEIAQNDCAHGHKTVNYWLHNEFLVEKNQDKMSKSKGEFLRIKSLQEKGFDAIDYRYFLLGAHYKKMIMFSWEAMDFAKNTMKKLKVKITEIRNSKEKLDSKQYDEYMKKFIEIINYALNPQRALALLWEVLNSDINDKTKYELAKKFDEVLGLKITEMKEEIVPLEIIALQKQRDDARANKEWKKSDELRNKIRLKGYEVLDEKEGSIVRRIN